MTNSFRDNFIKSPLIAFYYNRQPDSSCFLALITDGAKNAAETVKGQKDCLYRGFAQCSII
ncbi:hypothetical protein CDQ84_15235 [Clostridium thermosuccinogenes]|jgi:hypothetical protein|uniref:Uncharacterized protein n=1 Tax=Clostridium thermosuccinogenes TaxID=84032 RepID=A0A2K2F9L5_9CLOT|nr:hypothetical protein CDO33_14280 [Pseudoclostridium thermosuccinogenes]PNT93753.1 hypothetical protein CDQ83_09755 [Pseudoclostridium thermosuccinogenes]PNT95448.1 hypothetical protein CDQ85_14880 [Pseudoclostridium thermosuccinogenes]PNT96435.1 hypothetical protein CDQ84_15235 [Pseudoclostridium thermosuccinogenes]